MKKRRLGTNVGGRWGWRPQVCPLGGPRGQTRRHLLLPLIRVPPSSLPACPGPGPPAHDHHHGLALAPDPDAPFSHRNCWQGLTSWRPSLNPPGPCCRPSYQLHNPVPLLHFHSLGHPPSSQPCSHNMQRALHSADTEHLSWLRRHALHTDMSCRDEGSRTSKMHGTTWQAQCTHWDRCQQTTQR